MISHYSFGNITVDGKEYTHDVIISGRTVKDWWRNTSHEVGINDVDPILEEKPKLIIFGTGASGVCRVFPETIEHLKTQGIKVLVFETPAAVKEFNRLSAQGGVVGIPVEVSL